MNGTGERNGTGSNHSLTSARKENTTRQPYRDEFLRLQDDERTVSYAGPGTSRSLGSETGDIEMGRHGITVTKEFHITASAAK